MEIWLVAFIGGLVGSVLMDITEAQLSKVGISSGVTGAYVGRWAHSLLSGLFFHRDIATTDPVANELRIGQLFHFIIGGGVVALFYPLLLMITGIGLSTNHLLMASIFGLLTSALPWFILMPSFGWGLFGFKTPFSSRPILSPLLSHIPYGFGIGATLLIYYELLS
ncbi:hypothetical protein BOW53_12075 [Solemya pervernicosa gill symbiont]|uniref:DUF2938 domain-containing protein n=2 Tax=Gammaproteobacteria incertae sedis TaxID=118884 RepID=A0A1T2L2J4_9GAMM|nr:DUF2938 family protein [Candidatus Reidiella endopervernicosa]OOZ39294.1 hypothetical protein BOW53_12075 [Solemya pervernicosa gill symbiont]QKQ25526.1 DUF2938 family protein [Candidatus Reidiella endopervernicosa]